MDKVSVAASEVVLSLLPHLFLDLSRSCPPFSSRLLSSSTVSGVSLLPPGGYPTTVAVFLLRSSPCRG